MHVSISNGGVVLFLFDTGRMAYKFGKWRGAVYLVATAVPMALANLITTVLSVLPGRPQPPAAVQWIEGGFYALALLLWSYCCYRLYRDHVYHDYYLAADRHQREGW